MNELQNTNKYPIASSITRPNTERAIDIMGGYITRCNDYIDTINSNIDFRTELKEYIQINNFFPNRKTKCKDELRYRIVNKLVELNIYTQNEAQWLRYHDYFEIFIQMLQNSNAVSSILFTKESSLGAK